MENGCGQIAYDQRGGFFMSQYRANSSWVKPALLHVNKHGEWDFNISNNGVDAALQGGMAVSQDGSLLAMGTEAGIVKLWDVEYVREGSERFLRIYLDKEGGVDINDCEAVSRAMDPILDEADPIPESYHFEVCSAGLERALKRPGDFERFMGSPITVKLYRPRNGLQEIPGVLRGYEEGRVTLEAGKETITFEKSEVALVRLRVEF